MVDEHTGQLIADRLMDQDCSDRAIDSAREAANHFATIYLSPNVSDFRFPETGHRPVARASANVANEIGEELGSVRSVNDFRVEHEAKALRSFIGRNCKRRALRACDDLETLRQSFNAVTVTHPDLMFLTDIPKAVEQRAWSNDFDERPSKFPLVGADDAPPKLLMKRLLTVADRQQRNIGVEHQLRRSRTGFIRDRRGPAGKNHAARIQPLERVLTRIEGCNFAIDTRFANAPSDELRHLASEIDDENGLIGLNRHCGRIGSKSTRVKFRCSLHFWKTANLEM